MVQVLNMKPCPNPACEGEEYSVDVERDPLCSPSFQGWVRCDWCGMRGPSGGSEDEVVEMWNDLPRKRKKK